MTEPPSAASLNHHWIALNIARKTRNLHPLSLAHLAMCASNAEAIPGEAIHVSKSTVAAVLKGTYNTTTEPAIRARLAHCITVKFQDLNIGPLPSSPSEQSNQSTPPVTTIKAIKNMRTALAKPRTPRVVITRCDQAGYLTHNKRTYYLGPEFTGQLCTITSLRDRKDKGIRAATTTSSRIAYPVDPVSSQLGHKAAK